MDKLNRELMVELNRLNLVVLRLGKLAVDEKNANNAELREYICELIPEMNAVADVLETTYERFKED